MAEQRYVDWDGLVYYDGKIKDYIGSFNEQLIKMGGQVSFEELPPPSYQNLNYIYKITNNFTSTEGYFEKPGYDYLAGTWVQCVDKDKVYLYTIFIEEEKEDSSVPSQDFDLYAIEKRVTSVENTVAEIDIELDTVKDSISSISTEISSIQDTLDDVSGISQANSDAIEELDKEVTDLSSTVADKFLTLATKEEVSKLEADTKTVAAITEKVTYDVTPVEGLYYDIVGNEIRINAENVNFTLQQSGTNSDPNVYYVGLRAYAPSDAVSFREDLADKVTDEIHYTFDDKFAGTDTYGRNYSIVWLPVARYNSDGTWTYYGANSTSDNLIGWHHSIIWYDANNKVISQTTTKIVVTNSDCHSALISDDVIEFVNKKLANIDVDIDTSTLATKEEVAEVEAKIPSIEGLATEEFVTTAINAIDVPEVPTKVSELENDAGYALKSELPSVDGLATEEYVDEAISNVNVDLTGYATESWVTNQGYLTAHQDISHLETKTDAEAKLIAAKNYTDEQVKALLGEDVEEAYNSFKEIQDLLKADETASAALVAKVEENTQSITELSLTLASKADASEIEELKTNKLDASVYETEKDTFASKSDIPTDYLTSDDLTDYVKTEELPDTSSFITMSDVEDMNYATKDEVKAVEEKVEAIVVPTVDLTGYATEQWVSEQGYLTEHQSLDDYALRSEIPSIEGLAKTTDVETALESKAAKEHTHTLADITDYVTSDALETVVFTDGEVAGNYNDASISGKTLRELLEIILGPKIAVTNVTLDQTTLSLTVGDSVQLTATVSPDNATNKEVIWSVTGAAVTVDNGLVNAIAEGNATVKVVTVDQSKEATCEVTVNVIKVSVSQNIIQNTTTMYSVTSDGTLKEVPYNYISITDTSDNSYLLQEPTGSGFYQVFDEDGNLMESGYQDMSVMNGDIFYVVALPNILNYPDNIKLQTWDKGSNTWADEDIVLTKDQDQITEYFNEMGQEIPNFDIEGYTVWAYLEDTATGATYRYVIIEDTEE